ncbi:MAG: tRNA (uridine(34)/cytosine(34)/5-carboxymethylaminomethyluridine(34)-2'-O)-methyltransferase TrmL [Chromatiaceae bacterium]|jgi:tRNA (cytidine/uridine-2'-O-)-methyltransferase|nr:tRNA (uridine(34)/cytosine(34)/5-carboxymethylaminomethyluridine(34)-2'-O)-methyltransferase TrmL [Chromatiaceae bacterium]
MFQVVLYQPEIPPNTGNIMRLCANTGARLHLIEPLGFELDDRQLRRAGLDYREWISVRTHKSLDAYLRSKSEGKLYACSTRGRVPYTRPAYRPGDVFLFGPETRGLPQWVLDDLPEQDRLFIPMFPGNRSLNLSNAVAIVLYEAWRQNIFCGGRCV